MNTPAATRGVHHIGFTVPDISEAIAFFESMFGYVKVVNTGRFDVDGDFMENSLGCKRSSVLEDLVFLRCGETANIELFQFSGDSEGGYRRPSQVGGFHIAFQVDDADEAAQRLRASGVELLDGPAYIDEGPFEGLTWGYVRAPWGQLFELFSYDRLGYEDETDKRLFKPT
ncbi:MAG: glyoxalase/bleomycin resistance/dioxygenase family protein [Boseongicola sp. SB0664_bin_43]|uniref:Glyoxalase/bleomycin resistance/dioxygenase family protein n=1 Tax=Boseongicola sp. SB0664_bin_43 TaxID=2604844 RepID=A0A6B0Y2B3_9RHOB|nr:glyoxalase/bleomycin resistance/dioxygenase family protein [Boseongicola sp. SB0664_bin_43]